MNLTISGQVWDSANIVGRDWLQSYIREQWNIAERLVRKTREVPSNSWNAYHGSLEVKIYPTYNFGNAGIHTPLGSVGWFNPLANDRVEVSWDLEFNLKRHVLIHEFGHVISLHSLSSFSGDFGHGSLNDEYIKYIKKELGDANSYPYHGDVVVRHKRDFNTDL